jgi:hypothetical protein
MKHHKIQYLSKSISPQTSTLRLSKLFFSAFSHRGVGHSPYGFRLVEHRAYSSERPEAASSAVKLSFHKIHETKKILFG